MSRSDQYIGLRNQAIEFIKHFDQDNIRKEIFKLVTEDSSAFGNIIYGSKWYIKNKKGIEDEYFIEKVQLSPWASGPMYFTCLEYHVYNNDEWFYVEDCFQWWCDPGLPEEIDYDYTTGAYSV